MSRLPSTPDCAIKGCTRAVYVGSLCSKHYAMVPLSMARAAAISCMEAQHKQAAKNHRAQLAYVRRTLSANKEKDASSVG